MAGNVHRGWFSIPLAAGSVYTFDQVASMISAGSALGGAYDLGGASDGLVASVAFPRAASLAQSFGASAGAPVYAWDSMVFRLTGAGSCVWTTDVVGTPNASIGIAMFGNDPKPLVYPSLIKNFRVFANTAGILNAIFVQGDELDL